MTKINDAYGTVPLNGVTMREDLALRELWLAYALALSPFDFCMPDDSNGDTTYRPNVASELSLCHFCLRAIREHIKHRRDHTDFSSAIACWLIAVDGAYGFHGIRQAFLLKLGATHPIARLAAEPLMRARVDDAMIRLEGREYNECYAHILNELRSILTPEQISSLRNHVLSLST